MINMPSPITEDGDIVLHAKAGLRIPVFFQQENGAPRDMTGTTVKFYVQGSSTILLTAGTSIDELILEIPVGFYNTLIGKKADFALVDETAVPANDLWSGVLFVTGFA
jgi:hypothetical protein